MKRASPFDAPKKVKKLKFNIAWQYFGKAVKGLQPLMYLDGPDIKPSQKIAGFDIDGCLIVTNSGKTFATGPTDWKLFNNKVKDKLTSIREDGYKIVGFTNQMGIEKKKTKPDDLQQKFAAIMDELGFPFQVMISTGENIYRKPGIEQWNFMLTKCNGGLTADLSNCYYVGDAAGRVKGWATGKKKDFSCSDRKFAANVGVKFHTPEEYFNGEKECTKFEWGAINSSELISKAKSATPTDFSLLVSTKTEMVILVGFPASGKSTFAKTHLEPKNYVIVNRDDLKTQDKCMTVASESLKEKKSVVVDNTNPSIEARKPYIELAKKLSIPVRCFHFQATKELSDHMNMFRQSQSAGQMRRVPAIGYNVFKSKFVAPDISEGFTDIKKIDFVPDFKTKADKKLFKMWT